MRRILLSTIGVLVAVLAVVVWLGWRQPPIAHSVEIQATPAQVWAVLTDFDAYADWNPTIVAAEGTARVGEQLSIRMADGISFTPEVLTATPGRELRWRGHVLVPGLLDGDHRFVIERLGPDRVRLTQSERFSGVAGLAARWLLEATLDDFEQSNRALRERVETTAGS